MALTYIQLKSQVLSSNQTSVTFSSIPQTFTDLRLIINLRETTGGGFVTFNSNSGSVYGRNLMYGSGDGTITPFQEASRTNIAIGGSQVTAYNNQNILEINDYASTIKYKQVVLYQGSVDSSTAFIAEHVASFRSTAGISTITVVGGGANSLLSGSTFALYGMKV
jgi:hypothetical protein